ncbi:hypothetical protein [Kingella potus]|uniref:hypothetical protein n=1 Tax=Kingella potus TaxID=265175 RepID=UPI001FD5E075|nr:hypothetical protein [Kingella potus]UOP00355.1 hypothetical protein LVJ84_10715 [Kingella potus]
MKKTLAAFLALAAAAQLAAAPLTAADQGDYVLLDQNENPTPMQMQFALSGKQWVMNGREGDGQWQSVCRGTGGCRLVTSAKGDVEKWKQHLPESWRTAQLRLHQQQSLRLLPRGSRHGSRPHRLLVVCPGRRYRVVPLPVNRIK